MFGLSTHTEGNAIAARLAKTDRVPEINKQAAEICESLQIQLCPESEIQHTHLKETIHIEDKGPYIKDVVEGNDGENNYGPIVEHGDEAQIAQPHAEPARQEARRWKDEQIARL